MNTRHTKWHQEFYDRAILLGYRGSRAHGTWRPPTDPEATDDVDVMGVFVGPPEAYLGFGRKETHERMEDDQSTGVLWDGVFYDVRKFVGLLCKQNPNVLSMLWLPENLFIKVAPAGRRLIDQRAMFASKAAYASFTGYAYSQLYRMTRGVFNGYMGERRKRLVEKYGYDTKNAATLIMLLKMGIEFLSTGDLRVHREDNTYLVEIKRGALTLAQVKAEADRLLKLAESALVNSRLPDRVDDGKAEKLLVEILTEYMPVHAEIGSLSVES